MNLAMLTIWGAGYDLPLDEEDWIDPVPQKAEPKKGFCKHCGKHIGKGLHFHEKACKGAK